MARAIEDGKSAKELGVVDLGKASKEVLRREISLKPEIWKAALDVDSCVASRAAPGGPAPKSVRKLLKSLRLKSKQRSIIIKHWRNATNESEVRLLKEARRKY